MSYGTITEASLDWLAVRVVCVLTCLLLPVLTWSESFFELVEEADAATVQSAIDAGADLEARSEFGGTPLMFAIRRGTSRRFGRLCQSEGERARERGLTRVDADEAQLEWSLVG